MPGVPNTHILSVLVQNKPGCLAQMIEAYKKAGENSNIIAVEEVPMERIHQYGVVGVCKGDGKTFPITEMVEKPPRRALMISYRRSCCRKPGARS